MDILGDQKISFELSVQANSSSGKLKAYSSSGKLKACSSSGKLKACSQTMYCNKQ
jgi:hypothetical protein